MRRGSNMVGSTWNCIHCYEIWACAQLEPVFGSSATWFKFFKFGLRNNKLVQKLSATFNTHTDTETNLSQVRNDLNKECSNWVLNTTLSNTLRLQYYISQKSVGFNTNLNIIEKSTGIPIIIPPIVIPSSTNIFSEKYKPCTLQSSYIYYRFFI